MKIGIDAIAFDVAKLHLPIKTLAQARNIEPEKLEKGLGLLKMTLPDAHQDTIVFGANALTKLIQDNNPNWRIFPEYMLEPKVASIVQNP